MKEALQTVLEGLECTYMSCLNILTNTDEGYTEEETSDILNETSKNIILLLTAKDSNLIPMDKRVYIDLTTNNNVFTCSSEDVKERLINKLYEHEVLIKELTIGELVEQLNTFVPNLKVNILGEGNNPLRIVIDDTYTDKVILVGVEN